MLRYVRKQTKRFHTLVANCIAIIQDDSEPDQLRHAREGLNLGVEVSRGLSAEGFLSSKPCVTEGSVSLGADSAGVTWSFVSGQSKVKVDAYVYVRPEAGPCFHLWNTLGESLPCTVPISKGMWQISTGRDVLKNTSRYSSPRIPRHIRDFKYHSARNSKSDHQTKGPTYKDNGGK